MYNFKKIDEVSHRFMKFCDIYENIDHFVIVSCNTNHLKGKFESISSDYRVANIEILYT